MTEYYDIFISYRRDGGFETAKHLYDLLVGDGYTVSFDIDTLREGDFDDALLKRIDWCVDFILVVDKHTFDRTLNPEFDPKRDWLRAELAYALRLRKNIIPLLLSGVDGFPSNLPEDIVGVATKHGPEYNKYYFDEFYKRLKSFLHSVPRNLISDLKRNILHERNMDIRTELNKKEDVYDVFISYYRNTGFQVAESIFKLLTKEGYSVYFNKDSVREGLVDNNILKHVKRCRDFILIVDTQFATKTACQDNDWVNAELSEAIKRGNGIVNIIPILLPPYTTMPNSIFNNYDTISFSKPVLVSDLIGTGDVLIERLNSRQTYVDEKNAKRSQVNYDYSIYKEQALQEMANNPLFKYFVQLVKSLETY